MERLRRRTFTVFLAGYLGAACFVASGCARSSDVDEAARQELINQLPPDYEEPPPPTAVEVASTPYPRATWRLTDTPPSTMVIAASHILISFDEAHRNARWPLSVPRASGRTVDEAARIALSVVRRLVDEPGRFEELAREWSDDATTAQWGGRLGVFRGDQVSPEVLDALAVTPPTQVGQHVLRTELGFHIFRRDALPASSDKSLARLLVSHAGATSSTALRRTSSRTAAEARAIATSLADQIARRPDRFSRLVRDHSDGIEALRGGDLGKITAYERIDFPIRREVARELDSGQAPAIVQTDLGYELVVRTQLRRPIFAAAQILIADRSTSEALLCREAKRTRNEARSLAARVVGLARSRDFNSVARQYCDSCECAASQWVAGRGDPRVEHALTQLRPGEVGGPVETPTGFIILQRHTPLTSEAFTMERNERLYLGIPKPPVEGAEDYVTLVEGKALAFHARRLAEHILDTMKEDLSAEEQRQVAAAYEKLATDWEGSAGASAAGRHKAHEAWRRLLVSSVGAEKAQAVVQKGSEWVMTSAQ